MMYTEFPRGNDDPETYHTHHEWTAPEPVSYTVLTAVAAITGVPPDRLEPLTACVDPDALDELFRPRTGSAPRSDGAVAFPYNGCHVTVHADGDIVIWPVDEAAFE